LIISFGKLYQINLLFRRKFTQKYLGKALIKSTLYCMIGYQTASQDANHFDIEDRKFEKNLMRHF